MRIPEIKSWNDWAKIYTSMKIWEPVVREICLIEGIEINEVKESYPGTNAVFILDEKYVIKIAPAECHKDYYIECELGKVLENEKLIPTIIAKGVYIDRIDWPYMIMEFNEGTAIREVRQAIKNENKIQIFSELAEIIKCFHSKDISILKEIDHSKTGWLNFIKDRRSKLISELKDLDVLSMKAISEIEEFVNDFRFEEGDLVLLNADLTEDHLFLKEKNGHWRISALIDLADSMVGVREYEWVALWFGAFNRELESLQAFMKAYDGSDSMNEKFLNTVLAYTFVHKFGVFMIREVLDKESCGIINSLEELKEKLWFRVVK